LEEHEREGARGKAHDGYNDTHTARGRIKNEKDEPHSIKTNKNQVLLLSPRLIYFYSIVKSFSTSFGSPSALLSCDVFFGLGFLLLHLTCSPSSIHQLPQRMSSVIPSSGYAPPYSLLPSLFSLPFFPKLLHFAASPPRGVRAFKRLLHSCISLFLFFPSLTFSLVIVFFSLFSFLFPNAGVSLVFVCQGTVVFFSLFSFLFTNAGVSLVFVCQGADATAP